MQGATDSVVHWIRPCLTKKGFCCFFFFRVFGWGLWGFFVVFFLFCFGLVFFGFFFKLIYRRSICFIRFVLVLYPRLKWGLFWCGSIQQLQCILVLTDLLSHVTLLARSACLLCSLLSLGHLVRTFAFYWKFCVLFSFHNYSEFMYSEPLTCYEIHAWFYHMILALRNKEHSMKGSDKMLRCKN